MYDVLRFPIIFYKTQLVSLLYFRCSCASSSFNSSESKRAHETSASVDQGEENGSRDNPELDDKISKTLDTLQRLDATLTQNSIDPPINGGDRMKEMVQEYNKACADLLSLCKKDKLRVLNAASDMLEPGGPKFLDVEINKGEAMKNFKWNEDNVNEFLDLMKTTYSCWKKLWSMYNNFP